jgi:hypothetical protein
MPYKRRDEDYIQLEKWGLRNEKHKRLKIKDRLT